MPHEIKRKVALILLLMIFLISLMYVNRVVGEKNDIRAIQELVDEGEITEEQGEAVLWLLYDYKPNKDKK